MAHVVKPWRRRITACPCCPHPAQGAHPEYPPPAEGEPPLLLGTAERFFVEVALRVPRLAQRMAAAVYMRSFEGAVEEARVSRGSSSRCGGGGQGSVLPVAPS